MSGSTDEDVSLNALFAFLRQDSHADLFAALLDAGHVALPRQASLLAAEVDQDFAGMCQGGLSD